MIKLKTKNKFIKKAIPSQHIVAFNIPISDQKVRIYKFPHLSFNRPSFIEFEALQLKKGKLKVKYWTKRFLTLFIPRISQHQLFKYSYQLKKYGIDISYKLLWQTFQTTIPDKITPHKIKTHIPRKRVRDKNLFYTDYQFAILDLRKDFEMLCPNTQSYLQAITGKYPIQSLAINFPASQAGQKILFQLETPNPTTNLLKLPQIETPNINTMPVPKLQMKRIIVSANFDLKSSSHNKSIEALTPPHIQQLDINSPYMYALKKKSWKI